MPFHKKRKKVTIVKFENVTKRWPIRKHCARMTW